MDCSELSEIISKIENVNDVAMGWGVFYGVPTATCLLKVPRGKVDEYRQADQWKNFQNIVEDNEGVVTGDLDGNGAVDGTDLNILINIILGKDNAANYGGRANVNGEGGVDGNDLNMLINMILGKN